MDKDGTRAITDRRTFLKRTIVGTAALTMHSLGVPKLLKAANEPLKIGCIYPLTGPMVGYGLPTKAAMEYCTNKLNAKDGIMGRKIVPVFRDEQMSPEVTVRAVKELVLSEKCAFVGGCLSSADALAASLAVKDMRGRAFWTTYCATSSVITEEKFHRYTSRVSENTTMVSRAASVAALKRYGGTVKTVYSIHPDFAYGHSCQEEFLKYWKKHAPHVTFVGQVWPPLGCSDFTSYITAILAAKPDLVETSLYGGDGTIFLRQASNYGLLDKLRVVNPSFGFMAVLNNLRKGDPAVPKGVLAATPYPFYILNDPEEIDFYTEVQKKSGWYPDAMGSAPPIYLECLKVAMEKAGTTTDIEKIADVFDAGFFTNSFSGKREMRGCDHQTMSPLYAGIVGWDEKGRFPMPILNDVTILDNYNEMYHSCEEIKELRKKQG